MGCSASVTVTKIEETKIVILFATGVKEIFKKVVKVEAELEVAAVASTGVEEGVIAEGRALLLRAVRAEHVIVTTFVWVGQDIICYAQGRGEQYMYSVQCTW